MAVALNEDVTKEKTDNVQEFRIVKSWRNNAKKPTILFSIPLDLAKKYDITRPANLFLIPREDGILLRKVDTEGIN